MEDAEARGQDDEFREVVVEDVWRKKAWSDKIKGM